MQAAQAPDQAQGTIVTPPRRRPPVITHPYLWGRRPARGQDDGVGKQRECEPRPPVRLQVLPGRAPRRQDPKRDVSPSPERKPHPAPCTGHRLGVPLHRLRSEGDVTAPDSTASAGRVQSNAPGSSKPELKLMPKQSQNSWFGSCFLPFQGRGDTDEWRTGSGRSSPGRCPDSLSTWLQLFLLAKFTAGAINPFSD